MPPIANDIMILEAQTILALAISGMSSVTVIEWIFHFDEEAFFLMFPQNSYKNIPAKIQIRIYCGDCGMF